jgi:hypothetical protein
MRKFHDLELFCEKCLIHDTFFKGGGSWSPGNCPKCKGTNCVLYVNMTFLQQVKALELYEKMWNEKWNK